MAKFKEKIKARDLRKKGRSIKNIAKILSISKSTASIWCNNIELSKSQIRVLHERMVAGGYEGRIKGARMQKERKEMKIEYYENQGLLEMKRLTNNDLHLICLGLYLGEGSKSGNKFQFSNNKHTH